MARDTAQRHQAEGTELEAGTPSSALGEPSLSTDFQPLSWSSFLQFFFLHIPLPAPATTHSAPHTAGPDTLRQRGQHCCRPSGWFLLTGPKSPRAVTHTHPEPFSDYRLEPSSSATNPAWPPHSPSAPCRYSSPCELPAAPARSHRRRAVWEPGAKSVWAGLWEAEGARPRRGPSGARRGAAGP